MATCGHENEIILNSFIAGQGDLCSACSIKQRISLITLSLDSVRERFEKEGCILLSNTYVNNSSKLRYIATCGHENEISSGSFMSGQGRLCVLCTYKSGKDHHSYNHSMSDEERFNTRCYPEYKDWRIKVFNKDKYTCQCCGKVGGNMNAHHLYSYSSCESLRLEVSNGMTLCEENCHSAFHKTFGYKDNTKEQMEEFIKMNKCYHVSLKGA